MFECPECGGAIETTANCYFCIVCDFFDERHFIALDDGSRKLNQVLRLVHVDEYEWSSEYVPA
jgi:hypothetical protein